MDDIKNCKYYGIKKDKNHFIINNKYNDQLYLIDENIIYRDKKIPHNDFEFCKSLINRGSL